MATLLIVMGWFNISLFVCNLVRIVTGDPTVSTFTHVMLPISLLLGVFIMLQGFWMRRRGY